MQAPSSEKRSGKQLALGLATLAAWLTLACDRPSESVVIAPGSATPDIILIVIDAARVDRFGAYGYPKSTTPNIDTFAEDAVLYRGVRSSAPWTLPAHASILTGMRSGDHGLHFAPSREVRTKVNALRDSARDRLLASLLSKRGYATLGISNNRWVSKATGLDFGFDNFFLIPSKPEARRRAAAKWLGRPATASTAAELSVELFEMQLEKATPQRPTFTFFNLIEPHFPYLPVDRFAGQLGGDRAALEELIRTHRFLELSMLGGRVQPESPMLSALYDEELLQVDDAVGKILNALRKRDLYDDALIVITSDHGEHLGEDGRYSHQLSMRPELLDVPLIIKYPGGANAGSAVDLPFASTADIHQTLLASTWRENPHAGNWSQDLAKPDAFGREWNLAEYYYSPWYLLQIKQVAPNFDNAAHERVRRLVFTASGSHALDGREDSPLLGTLPSPIREEVQHYLAGLIKTEAPSPVILDEEDLDALRELGYVR